MYELFDEIRKECPVAPSNEHGGFFLVTGYDAVREACTSSAYSSNVRGLGAAAVVAETEEATAPLFETDGDAHGRWRRLLSAWFTPIAAKDHEKHVRAACRATIAEFADLGRADLVTAYCRRIPPLVIGTMLGLEPSECAVLSEHLRALSAAEDAAAAQAVGRALGDFLRGHVRARMAENSGDMLSAVAHAGVGGGRPTELEMLKFAFLMVAAGYLTTSDAAANILVELLNDPGLRDRCASGATSWRDVVEEAVRHEPAVAATGRVVLDETELAGVRLQPGDRVLLAWGGANRDPARFPDGNEFRPGRARTAVPHLGWGGGAHRCLGRQIARMELRIMLEELLAAVPDVRWQPGAGAARTYGVIRGVRSIAAEWTPQRAPEAPVPGSAP